MAGIMLLEQAGERRAGEGRLRHSWPTELRGRARLGLGQGVSHSHKAPLLGRWGLSLASGVASWGGVCGWDSHSLAFPGTDCGVCSQAPSIPATPLGATGLSSQPLLCQGVRERKRKRMWVHGDSSWGLGTHKPEGGVAVGGEY